MSAADLVSARDDLENSVRSALNISFNPSRPGIKHEHSMGMGNVSLPDFILKRAVKK